MKACELSTHLRRRFTVYYHVVIELARVPTPGQSPPSSFKAHHATLSHFVGKIGRCFGHCFWVQGSFNMCLRHMGFRPTKGARYGGR